MFIDINGKTLYEGDEVIISPMDQTEGMLVLPSYVGIITYEENKAWVDGIPVYIYDKLILSKRKDGTTT